MKTDRRSYRIFFVLLFLIGVLTLSLVILSGSKPEPNKEVTEALRLISSKNRDERLQGIKALRGLEGSGNFIPQFSKALHDPDLFVRAEAASALTSLGSVGLAEILNGTSSSSPKVRSDCAHALGEMGPVGVERLSTILKADEDEFVRWAAADALGRLGDHARPYLETLFAASVSDSSIDVRIRAAAALWKVAKHKSAIPTLIRLLEQPKQSHRMFAAVELGIIGRDAHEAVPALIRCLSDSDCAVRGNVATALGKIGPSARAAIPMLATMFRDRDQRYIERSSASIALSQMGKDALPIWRDSLKSQDVFVREEGARNIGSFGPYASSSLEQLVALLNDQDIDVPARAYSASSIGRIGVCSDAIVSSLTKGLSDSRAEVAIESAVALYRLTKSQKAISGLIDHLNATDSLLRRRAAKRLGELGQDASSAIPALTALLSDEDESVKEEAQAALESIRKHRMK